MEKVVNNKEVHHTVSLTLDQANELNSNITTIDALLGVLFCASSCTDNVVDSEDLCEVVYIIQDHFDKVKELICPEKDTDE